ncbi:Rhodanese-like domain-containing protein [Baffinella frigidus]|nr:Rhodanese-like domain-containing protein [Cryptophyta sp. CCMP2293]
MALRWSWGRGEGVLLMSEASAGEGDAVPGTGADAPKKRGRPPKKDAPGEQGSETASTGLRAATAVGSPEWEEEQRERSLVSTGWLAENLEDVTLLDVRGEVGKQAGGDGFVETAYSALVDDYLTAHIPGAVFVDWTKDITEAASPGARAVFVDWTKDITEVASPGAPPVQLADEARFTSSMELADEARFTSSMEERGVSNRRTVVVYDSGTMLGQERGVSNRRTVVVYDSGKILRQTAGQERGVSNGRTVVVYDSGKMLFATRLWWALTFFGHPDVRVLDGGFGRWEAEERATSDAEPCPLKLYSTFEPSVNVPSLRAEAEETHP